VAPTDLQTTPAAPRRRSALTRRRYLTAALLLLPALGLRLFTTIYPFFDSFRLSLTNYNPAFPPSKFIGLQNFVRISHDVGVRSTITFTIVFVVLSTLLQLVLGIAAASLLNSSFRGRGVVRAINLIPWAIPMVVAAIGFNWLYNKDYGLITDLVYRVSGVRFGWLSNYWGAKVAVIGTNVWKSTPFLALVFLAARLRAGA